MTSVTKQGTNIEYNIRKSLVLSPYAAFPDYFSLLPSGEEL